MTGVEASEQEESFVGIKQMKEELFKAGWVELNSTTYVAPNGKWYRGPHLAWEVMKKSSNA